MDENFIGILWSSLRWAYNNWVTLWLLPASLSLILSLLRLPLSLPEDVLKLKSNTISKKDVMLVENLVGEMLMKISCALLHIHRHLVLGLVSGQVPLHVVQEVEPPSTDHTGVRLHHRPAPRREKSTQKIPKSYVWTGMCLSRWDFAANVRSHLGQGTI